MEQRILQYRRSIDEWLTEMEHSIKEQEGDNAEYSMLSQDDGKWESIKQVQNADNAEQSTWALIQDKLEEHLVQVEFFQHERLIHLIVTVTFALLEMLAIVLSMISDSLFTLLLPAVILILLIPYIRHYYILENEVQKMYVQYDRMRRLQQMNAVKNGSPENSLPQETYKYRISRKIKAY